MHLHEPHLPDPVPVVIDGASIATYVLEPDGPSAGDVVLCHGTPWSSRVWAQVARRLSATHRVHLWDMPGYGRSTMDAGTPVGLPTQSVRLARLLSHWGLDRPHVVAHDVGGAVALGAHLLHGAEYADLFLWDAVTLDPWGSPFFRLVADHPDVFPQLPPALHAALVREYVSGASRHRLDAATTDVLVEPWLDEDGQRAFYRQVAALRPEDTRPVAARLGEVRCEVGVGWGAEDPWVPVEQAGRLRALLPGDVPVVELDDVGHLAPLEAPGAVHHALDAWLSTGRESLTLDPGAAEQA
ncbi:predicted hydrolase or acyltransferase of alpha/beta superfamily [Sanguibacter keddieii DSM 10542]|uniref:Predicted hydrolase or acyltransferase of alpha/beta superfamily n=1 Tax=Sanguibacter keddieii (strain ATCC 51767 / DSM 10542 / NCFB 3025 / ST-74) TaxID=446469 RepID=D1BFS7_SANKS|nr:alpha/beta hydrolase [Sanguibacter keddieii]ACZ21438.1 predicted hydrolase or acyltransferase of alpha/beta superfamily [Sanguibacter keddieii DSM 10542]